jgi:hypothetical protein
MKDYDLEQELISSELIVNKCKNSVEYCTALYSALCNMQWQKTEVWPTLSEERWSCTWRYAGGIIAKILNEGDYMDWYCRGNEGHVADFIAEDLLQLGWIPIDFDIEDVY